IDALRRSERSLTESQRVAHLGSYEVDLRTGRADWSEELHRLLGFAKAERGGSLAEILERVDPRDRARVGEEMARIEACGQGEFEHRVAVPGGRPRIVYVRMRTDYADDGRALRQFGTVLDITDRRMAEQALEASEGRFRRLAEHAPDLIFRYRLEPPEGFEYLSPASSAVLGYAPDEFYADAELAARVIHPEDRDLEKPFTSFEDGGGPMNLRWVRKDGRVIWVELRRVPVRDAAGRLVALEGIARDVTDRRQAERLLRETGEALEALVQASPLSITVVDRSAHVLMWNPAAARLFGWSAEEVLGRTLPIVAQGQREAFRTRLQRDIARGVSRSGVEIRARRRDGSPLDVNLWTAPLRDADGAVVASIGIFADDTERRAAAQELSRRRELLSRLASRLSLAEEQERRRIATELHDGIGQTLAFAKMHLRGLQAAESGDAAGLEKLGGLLDQAIRETRSLTAEISCSALYRFGLVPALRWLCERTEERHGVACSFEHDEGRRDLPENLKVLVYQTVRELVNNAVKHAPGADVRVSLETGGGEMRIRVEDDGAGFAPSGPPSDPAAPSGFGLFSIQERWGEYGGRLTIDGETGCGARVSVTAPLSGTTGAE
ncbi:MAG: PAS domain S-box protein, partial [Deltaproteobacteria bacterium]|nr:PAS domain S-box protein [Deltaproteobacteria bacterium]